MCVPDGCADEPVGALDGATPLEAASMPVLAGLAARAELGRAAVIPEGLPPGSDVGNMSIFGYDPAAYHTGRAPIEAAALGIELAPGQVAYRCNLVRIGDDGTMVDFAGGHPTSEQARPVIDALQSALGGDGIQIHAGVEYRHILVAPAALGAAEAIPPHDLTGRTAVWPTGEAAPALRDLMERSRAVLDGFDLDANQIWLWGQGHQPQMPSFAQTYGVDGALCSAVDLVRGLGVLTGIRCVEVTGMTAGYDTDYRAQRDAALDAFGEGADLFIIHVEATDEAGHAGDVAEKVAALQRWDSDILAGLVSGLDAMGSWRMLLLPDHATPLGLRTHTPAPVPYMLFDSTAGGAGGTYSEAAVRSRPLVQGHTLMGRLLKRA